MSTRADEFLSSDPSIADVVDETWPDPGFPRASASRLKGSFIVMSNPWNAFPPFVPGPGVTAPDPPSPRVLPIAAVNCLRFDGRSGVAGQFNVRALQRHPVTGETFVSFGQNPVRGEYYLWRNTQSKVIEGRMELRLFDGNVINQFYLLRRAPSEWYMVLRKLSFVNPPIADLQNASNAMLLKVRNPWYDFLF